MKSVRRFLPGCVKLAQVAADLPGSDRSNNSQELLRLRLEGNVLQARRVQALPIHKIIIETLCKCIADPF